MKYPLMRNNILREDLDAVIEHLKQDDPILTHGANVRAFEAEWSEWLGVKYSVFVNSGSSASVADASRLSRSSVSARISALVRFRSLLAPHSNSRPSWPIFKPSVPA